MQVLFVLRAGKIAFWKFSRGSLKHGSLNGNDWNDYTPTFWNEWSDVNQPGESEDAILFSERQIGLSELPSWFQGTDERTSEWTLEKLSMLSNDDDFSGKGLVLCQGKVELMLASGDPIETYWLASSQKFAFPKNELKIEVVKPAPQIVMQKKSEIVSDCNNGHEASTFVGTFKGKEGLKKMNNFENYQQKRNELVGIIDEARKIFLGLKDEAEVSAIDGLMNKLRHENFKVLVIGEFKRGKSTFINALMHKEILPAYSVPCTAIINEIKYGEEEKAVVHFKQKVEKLPEGLADDIKGYINRNKGSGVIPPLTIPIDKLEECVTIIDVEKEQAEAISESPFDFAEIYVPLDICRNGVEIIDSPGLNEHGTRDAVTTKYSHNVDAIIFVLLCQPLASGSELKSIDDLRALKHEDIFFICNSFDLVRDKERPRVMQMAKTRLGPRTKLGDRGLHFVSSLKALEARTATELDADTMRVEEEASNFPMMEEDLSQFLVCDRGRIKLSLPAKAIGQKLSEGLCKKIESKIRDLGEKTEVLEQKVRERKACVADLRAREEANLGNLEGRVSVIKGLIERETLSFIEDIATNVPNWVKECVPNAGLGILFTTKNDIENVSRELVDYATERIKESQEEWRKTTLEPRVNEEISKFRTLAETYVAEFLKKKSEAEGDVQTESENGTTEGIDKFYVDNGIDQSIFSDLMVTAAPSVAISIGMAFLGFLSPWIMIPALLGAGGLSRLFNKESKMDNIKESVGKEMANQIRIDGIKKLHASPEALGARLTAIIDKFKEVFEREIEGAEARADQALADSNLNQQEVDERKRYYNELLSAAATLVKRNDEFLGSL